MLSDQQIGQWVRGYRDQRHLSQQDVARILGSNQASVSRIEKGKRKLTAAEYLELQTRAVRS